MNQFLWESLKPLFEEMKSLGEIITQDDSRWHSIGTLEIHIHFAIWEAGEKFYLIACNISSESVEVKFNLEQIAGKNFAAYQSWFEGNRVQLSGSRLGLKFLPYERQVIELW